jgi:hypothetical protein
VYDLRKSSSVSLALQGHQQAVNCIRFASKLDSKDPKQSFSGVGNTQSKKNSEMKTIEQIREEAK